MNVANLLGLFTKAGIKLSTKNNELKIVAAKGAVTAEIKQMLIDNKAALLDYLSDYDNENGTSTPELLPRIQFDLVPLSFSQQRLWFIDQLGEGSAQYNSLDSFTIHGKYNVGAFKRALTELLNRHEVLRTHFVTVNNEPLQKIVTEFELPYAENDLSSYSENEIDNESKLIAKQEANIPFDLAKDLMLRVRVLKLSDDLHIVLNTTHHIASDGWSRGLLKNELNQIYLAYNSNNKSPFNPLRVQYADFALWQRQWLQGDVLEKQLGYWRNQLKGIPLLHNFPLDKSRLAEQSYIGNSYNQVVSKTLAVQLKQLCSQQDVTLFMLMHAAFSVLLSRYSNEYDIVVGTAIAGRHHQHLEPLIGFFVNDLVLRAQLSENPKFVDFLAQHKKTILNAYKHQQVPFEMLVETLNPSRSLTHNPLFQIKLDLQNHSGESGQIIDQKDSSDKNSHNDNSHQSREDLYLSITEHSNGLKLQWSYNTDLFEAETIQRLAGSFTVLLQSVLANIDTKTSQLNILDASHKDALLIQNNSIENEFNPTLCIHQLFQQQVEKTPDNFALVFEQENMSYSELNQQANQLAHYLIKQGVTPDTLVAICVERSLEMIVGLLAILKAGAAYVPMDPSYPRSRLNFMLEDCAVDLVLTQQDLMSELEFGDCKIVPLDSNIRELLTAKFPDSNPQIEQVNVKSFNLAYAIYTSGSTGEPRAVLINHKSLVASTVARNIAYPSAPSSFILFSSYAFDSSVAGIFWTLVNGGELVIAQVSDGLEVAKITKILSERDASHLLTLPSVYSNILEFELPVPQSMRQIIVAGEACDEQLPKKHFNHPDWKNCQLINEYGPTEACVWSSYYDCANYKSGSVPIGHNAPHVKLYVVNSEMQLAPVGVVGELLIGGEGVAREYLNQAELTQQKFINDPFSEQSGQRLYKTGDMVRWLSDGNLEYVGRCDSQVKIRGFRVELREIENQLLELDKIKSSVVVVQESEEVEKRLVGYLVLQDSLIENVVLGDSEETIQEANLEQRQSALILSFKNHLQDTLPYYMVPSVFVVLEKLPLTPNGKVDKKSLPQPQQSDVHNEVYVAPRNEIEESLCILWQEVLQIEKIGIDDNFFMLGGHSLLGTKLISLIRMEFSTELPLKTLFEAPTISSLAEKLKLNQGCSILPPVAKANREQPLLLSHAQQRLWFIDKLSGSIQYNVPSGYWQKGEFKLTPFKRALTSLLQRHEVLRTHFEMVNGEPRQVIVEKFKLPLIQHDLSHLDEQEQQRQLDQIIIMSAKSAFNLNKDLMLRVRLVKLSKTSHLILYTMHHIASDGWSSSIIQNELNALYEAYCSGLENPLEPLKIQYVDYALWQRKWLQGEFLEEQLNYWRQNLAGVPSVHKLPLDRPRPVNQTFEGEIVKQLLDENLTLAIRKECEKNEVTLFMFLQSAFAVLLSRYSNETDIVIGSPIAGRIHKDIEGLIGFFVNALTIRVDLSDNPTFSELLKNNKQTILDAYAHQHIPFEFLVEKLRPERNLNHNPLFQITFVVQNNERGHMQLQETGEQGNDARPASMKSNIRNDLEIHVIENGDQLSVYWLYNDALFDGQTVARMAENYQVLMVSIIESLAKNKLGQVGIDELKLVSDADKKQVLTDWNGFTGSYDLEQCVHSLFEQQVEQTPDNIAVELGNDKLNFKELNSRANKLAHFLIQSGIKPDSLVLLCFDRSIEMIIALLGVLKAGGAYVPVNPSLPQSRIDYICRDSEALIVLAEEQYEHQFASFEHVVIRVNEDELRDTLSKYPKHNPSCDAELVGADNLAYVLYTSGTTGTPKGVMVEHKSVVNLGFNLRKIVNQQWASEDAIWAQNANLSFDASVQALTQLIFGTKLVLIPQATREDANKLAQYLIHNNIGLFDCTPSQLSLLLDTEEGDKLPTLIIGGEKVGQELWSKLASLNKATGLKSYNVYGPTEACVDATICAITNENRTESLGNYLDNVVGYVVSTNTEQPSLVPIGSTGELYLGGAGIARGYLNRNELTHEKFIANPFSEGANSKLYKTGDLVRYCVDGKLEFIDRLDDQVKIRGFRVELGEIESQLTAHESINTAVVSINSRDTENKQLIAYVCPTERYLEELSKKANSEDLAEWTKVFDAQYIKPTEVQVTEENFVGWNSSYTGEPIDLEQMRQWQNETLDRIKTLKPRRLLEIGCGTGLLLYGYAPWCESVHAMDISGEALAGIQLELANRNWNHVELSKGDALSFGAFADQTFDTVVINSVVQYFPNPLYLKQVIDGLMPFIEEGGQILLGDIRNYDLFISHLAAVEESRLSQSTPVSVVSNRVQRRLQQEPELLVSPSFFTQLKQTNNAISQVDVLVKRGCGDNEMLRYRYEVVITKASSEQKAINNKATIRWYDFKSLDLLDQLIVNQSEEIFGVSGVPNARIKNDFKLANGLVEWQSGRLIYLTEMPGMLDASSTEQVNHLESLLIQAEQKGYSCAVTWSQENYDSLDLIFSKINLPEIQARSPYVSNFQTNFPKLDTVGIKLGDCLKAHLATLLPDYMLPQIYIAMQSMPLTINGKVDKKALPLPLESDLQRKQHVAPRNRVQEKLCLLWEKLLKVEQIGIEDNFFALGGHSLLATRLTSAIREEFNTELALAVIFESPTVETLAERIKSDCNELILPPVLMVNRDQPLPLSYAQQRLWFIDLLGKGSLQYNMSNGFVLAGEFYEEAFKQALTVLIDRHEVLRSHFNMYAGEAQQKIVHNYNLPYVKHDLSNLDEIKKEKEIKRLIVTESQTPFNLSHDLLLRVLVLKLDNNLHLIIHSTHHIASDGWSMTILKNELTALYDAFKNHESDPLPKLPVQYADYAQWQRQWLSGEVLKQQLGYWQNQLSDIPVIHSLPLDKERPAQALYDGAILQQTIGDETRIKINALCQRHEVTIFMFLETAFALLIGRYSEEQDIIIGSPIAGRTHKDVENLIGFFVNTLVLRTDLSPELTFTDLLNNSKQVLLEAYEHQHIPFEMLVEKLSPERNMNYNPIFQIVFAVQNNEQSVMDLGSEKTDADSLGIPKIQTKISTRFDLELSVMETSKGLHINWTYNESLFMKETIERLASSYDVLLTSIIDSLNLEPSLELKLPSLDVIGNQQKTQLLEKWCNVCANTQLQNDIFSLIELPVNLDTFKSQLPHMKVYLLDENHQLALVGCKGNLYIQGLNLDQNNDQDDNFIVNPFDKGAESYLYNTSRKGRWLSNSELEILAEISDSTVSDEFSENLREVEELLQNHPLVKQVVVIEQDTELGTSEVVAYWVNQGCSEIVLDQESLHKDLSRFVRSQPTLFVVPSSFVLLEEFPLNHKGEVDRKLLVESNTNEKKDNYVAPTTDIENRLCRLWQNVLELDRVGIHDNFFIVGGHSLLATRVISAIREEFEVELPISILFEAPTVAMLSESIDKQMNELVLPPVTPTDRSQVLALSYAQQRLWFIDLLGKGSLQYNMSDGFVLAGDYNEEAFKLALKSILERHEVLRTYFSMSTGEVRQVIVNDFKLPYVMHDLSDYNKLDKSDEVQRLLEKEAMTPFDLGADLLLRVLVVKLDPDLHLIIHSTHHIASDGWSMKILKNELNTLYQAFNKGELNPLAPLPVQYVDYAQWQRQWLSGEMLEQQLGYWQQHLKNIPVMHNLPLDKKRPSQATFDGALHRQFIGSEMMVKIHDVCQKHEVTLFMFLETAFALLIGRNSDRQDVVIGSPIAGRTHQDVEGLIGFFVNTLVLRSNLSGEQKFSELLENNKQVLLDAYEYQHIPFEMLVETLSPERHMNYNPVFQIIFAVQNNEQSSAELGTDSLETGEFGIPQVKSKKRTRFDLELSIVEKDPGMVLSWSYNLSLFAQSTVSRLATSYEVLLNSILDSLSMESNKELSIEALEFLGSDARNNLLLDWNNTKVSPLLAQRINQLLQSELGNDLATDVFANLKVYVLDKQLQLVPIGSKGDIYVAGIGFEHLTLEQKENANFVVNPFAANREEYLYLTTSSGRWNNSGELEVIAHKRGRATRDEFNAKLVQVEKLLSQHPSVDKVVVLEQELEPDTTDIIAYWTHSAYLEGGTTHELQQKELSRYIRTQPELYLMPSSFVFLDSFPIQPNGEVDKRLLTFDMSNKSKQTQYIAPTKEREIMLCRLWQELLSIEQVGIDDNFFAIGGHSLLATRMTSSIREIFDVELPISVLFESPTIRSLSQSISEQAGQLLLPKLVRADREQPLALSHAQQRLWYIDQLGQGSSQYNMCGHLLLPENFDRAAFEKALGYMLDRHEVLRTHFAMVRGRSPRQLIVDRYSLPLQFHDLSQLEENQQTAAVKKLVDEEAIKPFDLGQDLMLRVQLLKLTDSTYAVLYTMHHIVGDGWSVSLLEKELIASYKAYRQGEEPDLLPLRIQYADYAQWQRQWLKGGVLEKQLDYWQIKLAGIPTVHSLPLDNVRPSQQTYDGHEFIQLLDNNIIEKIRAQCEKQNVTLFIFLETVFAVLVSRYSNSNDIVIGSPMSGRNHKDLEGLIGFFVNSLILRTDLSDSPTFSELLRRNKQTIVDGYAHQHTPFEMLVEKIRPERHLNYNPVYQISFTTHISESKPLKFSANKDAPKFVAKDEFVINDTSIRFDLMLSVKEKGDNMSLVWSYNKSLFNDDSIVRMAKSFSVLLDSIVDSLEQDPALQKSVGQLSLLSEVEKAKLFQHGTESNNFDKQFMHGLFEEQANKTPINVAASDGNQTISYDELNQKANQLAHYLCTKGVGPDSLVAICMDTSIETLVALLGILKSGGAYLPIDLGLPKSRKVYMLEDSGVDLVLTQSYVAAELSPGAVNSTNLSHADYELICLDEPQIVNQLESQSTTNLNPHVMGLRANNLAYVIYTSGSTGKPKGVLVEHKAVVDYCTEGLDTFYSSRLDGSIVMSSLSFDATLVSIYFPLLRGDSALLFKANKDLVKFWNEILITDRNLLVKITPSHILALSEMSLNELTSQCQHSFVVGGEQLSVKRLLVLQTLFPKASIYNQYGPTEAVIGSTFANVSRFSATEGVKIPIGRPFSNTEAYVLNQNRELTPIGVPGELYLGGDGLARGYLNNSTLTKEKFISNPFSNESSNRIYQTGDTVRWLPGGELEFIGRVDDQIKVRGYRIELTEIKANIEAHPLVQASHVMVREDKEDDFRIVAYVTLRDRTESETQDPEMVSELRDYLTLELPEYMIPNAWIILASFPLTQNGKIDHNALPVSKGEDSALFDSYVAPYSETEKCLVNIWSELLNLDQKKIGLTDNFFALGGHSLLVMRMVSELQSHDLHTSVSEVVGASNLAEIGILIDAKVDIREEVYSTPPNLIPLNCQKITPEMLTLVDLTPTEITNIVRTVPGGAQNIQDIYPLIGSQEGILFHHLMDPKNDPYLESKTLLLDGKEQVDLLLGGLQALIDRHDVFRTAIVSEGVSNPVQVVYRNVELPVEILTINSLTDVESQLQQHLESFQAMNLQQAPMLRVKLAAEPDSSRWFLFLQHHHLASDNESYALTGRELDAHAAGRLDELETPVAYREFVAHILNKSKTLDTEAYFTKLLADVEEPTLPFNLTDIYGNGREVESLSRPIDKTLAKAIRGCARDRRVSPACLFHAAWAWVLGACSGRDDVVFGTVLSGRLQGVNGIERALGMFINTLPLRVKLEDCTARQLVVQTERSLKELLPYEQAPLSKAQQCSGIANGLPLFSAIINYTHGGKKSELSKSSKQHSGIRTINVRNTTNYPFELSVSDKGEGFTLDAQIDRTFSAESLLNYMERALTVIVEAINNDENTLLRNISIVPALERELQLKQWNDTQKDYSQEKCVHELFEQQVDQKPDNIAVVFEEVQLTYRELNEKANQLAHYLVKQGVKPETLVGFCVERSIEMLVGLLAIFKSGGVYVPLDPGYPRARLKYMLDDSQVSVIITLKSFLKALPVSDQTVILLDDDTLFASYPSVSLVKSDMGLGSNNLAYVIYTSGSTGEPKGVLIEHQSLSHHIQAMQEVFALTDNDSVLQFANPGFDLALEQILTPLVSGSQLCLRPSELVASDRFADWIIDLGITTIDLPPSYAVEVLPDLFANEAFWKSSGLRQIIIGNETFPLSVSNSWSQSIAHKACRLLNAYGPTETCITSHIYELTGKEDWSSIPLGNAVGNTSNHVFDSHQNIVPIGVVGELYIGGDRLARGYLNQPELTHEKFVINPCVAGERLYKTGDLVRYLPDGNLEFIGRVDEQVKIRGFRIELGEIEYQLSQLSNVTSSVVQVQEDEQGQKSLVAYITVEDKLTSDLITSIRESLKSKLPEYMVPSFFLVLDELPLTPNGKIDKQALPRLQESDLNKEEYLAPRNSTEQSLCDMWQTILNVDRIGIDDNFFSLGGHSLLATRLVSAIRHQFNIELPLRALFDSPTIAGLSERLLSLEEEYVLPPIKTVERHGIKNTDIEEYEF